MSTRKNAHKGGRGSVGLLIAGTAAAASAATYYLYGPKGVEHRKQLHGLVLKASGEVVEQVEKLKHIDKKRYEKLIARVTSKYKKLKTIDRKDIEGLKKELMAGWKHIEKAAKKGATQGRREALRMMKK